MRKRGQFYLVTSIVIIGIIIGFATLANSVQKRSSLKFYYDGEELDLELGKIMDYAVREDLGGDELNQTFDSFFENYTLFSQADNFYFIFGNSTGIEFRGYQKTKSGDVRIVTEGPENELLTIDESVKAQWTSSVDPGVSVNFTIINLGEDLEFEFFMAEEGYDIYYVITKEIGGDRYLETNA